MHRLYAIPLNAGADVRDYLQEYKEIIFKRKGIPPIIDPKKMYDKFEVAVDSANTNSKCLLIYRHTNGCFDVELKIKKEEEFIKFACMVFEKMSLTKSIYEDSICTFCRNIKMIRNGMSKRATNKLNCQYSEMKRESINCDINDDVITDDSINSTVCYCHNQNSNHICDQNTIRKGIEAYFCSDYKKLYSQDSCAMHLLELIPKSYEVLGSIAILNLNSQQYPYRTEIAAYIYAINRHKSIYYKKDAVKDTFRTTQYDLLLGDENKEVVHTENGITYKFKIGSVYFNSKLSGVREHLTSKFNKGDVVADLFCGIGPITINALKRGCYVIANDINPEAIESLRYNLKINKIYHGYEIYNSDAMDVIHLLSNRQIDHFVFNLPELSIYFIKHIIQFKSGVLHCFFFCSKNKDVVKYLNDEIGLIVDKKYIKECRNVSPSKLYYYLCINIEHLIFKND